MKKTILALMLATISIEAQAAFYAYYPLEQYKGTSGSLPGGSIVFTPDQSVTPPNPVDPVEPTTPTQPVEPEPTEEELKGDCYNQISEIVGDFGFTNDAAVKEYENGQCAVDLSKVELNATHTRYLHEYVNLVLALGKAGITPTFKFTYNINYNASSGESYLKQYNLMMNAIKINPIYSNVSFAPRGNYQGLYKGYKIYASTNSCADRMKAMIDTGYTDYYFGTLYSTVGGSQCNYNWTELFKNESFINTTK
ncbi:hypothetical protein [Pseudomonas sp. HY7a-MNA-CIBAN-0227]|uniref:hypothetical protein n=1 Tax=Pseudomonas sp. HY7a-MNA-CIBAN-0227 TaxID=3140474 RepID=UPI003322C7B1